jgi:hypothetical protein
MIREEEGEEAQFKVLKTYCLEVLRGYNEARQPGYNKHQLG